MSAPQRFAAWMSAYEHTDRRYGHVYRYHSRSDAHSIQLCTYVMEDILSRCPVLAQQAANGQAVYGINLRHTWPTTGKAKTLDLAIGSPATPLVGVTGQIAKVSAIKNVLFACEAKSVMTEHGKSQPRVYDELSSSHEIVHQGGQDVIAAGITVVNVANKFASPLRQKEGSELRYSIHRQPHVTDRMVNHLRGLPIREHPGEVGFDAYCTIVIDCDNQTPCALSSSPPAPQPGDRDHYETFIDRIARFYTERFSSLPN